MVFGPFLDVWHHIITLKPAFISKNPHFNFITIHYFWIFGLTIVGSILLYPAGHMPYIDALFFASGACTQSGLNTIDVNLLNTYQQIILFLLPMLTNPITINTFVVFLRLYWFEKRFQRIAREAKRNRRTLSKSRSQMNAEQDLAKAEQGVNGRKIVVMHDTTRATGKEGVAGHGPDAIHSTYHDVVAEKQNGTPYQGSAESAFSDSPPTADPTNTPPLATHQTQIKFADQVTRSNGMSDEPLQMPRQWSDQDHIAVLERQRNPQDKGVLRIPGPRDAERGIAPETMEEEDAMMDIISRQDSILQPRTVHSNDQLRAPSAEFNHDGRPPTRAITITEPERPTLEEKEESDTEEHTRAAIKTLSVFRLRKPRILTGSKIHSDHPHHPAGPRTRRSSFSSFREATSRDRNEITPYLSWQPTIGRNSAFVDLTEAQREELGGIEYRSLKSLALILVLYFWGFSIFGCVSLLPWIIESDTYGPIVDAVSIKRTWWAFFSTSSAFNDVGFTLTPDSMISFQTAIWPLLLMSFLIIIGNTGFPIMLRAVIWLVSKIVPASSGIWEELMFLLDHPRRCFTLLFPSKATWWLFWILVILNGIDLIFFIILDLGTTVVTALPTNIKILDGWFQAVSTRTAGLACVDLASLHPAIQVSYMIMMYISVLPIAISVRRTNVYEEKSLGIYGSASEDVEEEGEPSYVGAHLRRQLSFDLWYIFLGLFIISISEGPSLQSNDQYFTLFTVLFEIISAYGTVGLSLGYPTINSSFSTKFGTLAKLVIIAMQLRGRHRGLPYELDRAILLPSDSMHEKEDKDAAARIRRRNSASMAGGNSALDLANGGGSTGHGRSRERTTSNFLSRMMHPGPALPRTYTVDRSKEVGLWKSKTEDFEPKPRIKRALSA